VAATLCVNHRTALALLARMEREGIVGPPLARLKRSACRPPTPLLRYTVFKPALSCLCDHVPLAAEPRARCAERQVLRRVSVLPAQALAAALSQPPAAATAAAAAIAAPAAGPVADAAPAVPPAPSTNLLDGVRPTPARTQAAAVAAAAAAQALSPGQLARTLSHTHLSDEVRHGGR
jgi:hypothetical protein